MMEEPQSISRKTVLLMAIATGIIVANLNFIQPIEGLIATDFSPFLKPLSVCWQC